MADGTRENIIRAATAEFLARGYEKASLRRIAASAQLTTGAIYRHFSSKADLFDAIVSDATTKLLEWYRIGQEGFYQMPAERQTFEEMARIEKAMSDVFCDYIYDHRDVFLLVLTKSSGTRWEHYLDRFVETEHLSTERFAREAAERGANVRPIEPRLSRSLAKMLLRSFFQPLELGLTREEARTFIMSCVAFFHAGYRALMDPTA